MRTPILLVLLAALLVPAFAAPARPEFPKAPPSRLPASTAGGEVVVRLQKGWNVVSLPLASLRGAGGFPYAWLELAGSSWVERNPSVDAVDTGKAYLTYADAPCEARVSGVAGTPRPTRLVAGWNLLGCPSPDPIALESLTVDAGSFHAAVQAGVVAPGGLDYRLPTPQPLDLADGEQLEPGRALAVYVSADTQVKWPWAAAGAGPSSSRPDPRAAWTGEEAPPPVASTEPPGAWTGEEPPPPVASTSRPDPRAASTGEAPMVPEMAPVNPGAGIPKSSPVSSSSRPDPRAAARGEAPSTAEPPAMTSAIPFPLPTPGPPGRGTGTLAGRVEDSSGRALRGARVRVSTGASTTTNSNGEFVLQGLEPGPISASITRSGYKAGSGRVTVPAGGTRRLLVRLSPLPGTRPGDAPKEVKTTMTIVAHRYYSDGRRYSVKRIEVSEYGGSGYWSNTWYRTYDNYVELRCPGAVVGRIYKVTIYWMDWKTKGELRGVWEPKLWKEEQREIYYNP